MTLLESYCAVLNEIENPVKDKTADVRKYKYQYADLSQVLAIVKAACQKHGLTVMQDFSISLDGINAIGTYISDGQERMLLAMSRMLETSDAQALGSWITYMRRYQLMTVFGMAAEDDDGAATKPKPKQRPVVENPDPLQEAQMRLVEAEKRYCDANGIPNWGDFHREQIIMRRDYANDVETLDRIAQELIDAS